MSFKIIADSSSDMLSLEGIPFEITPLKIVTDKKEYVDNQNLNVDEMVDDLFSYKGKSSSSCPNADEWLTAFGDSKYIFCITITATLSGSYNAACIAKEMYEEQYPDRKVFVINSLSTGPEMKLIIEKIKELIAIGNTFEEICEEVNSYTQKTGLIFMLESMKNLANNGRVSHIAAKAAGLLGIRVVGKASDVGDLQPLDKARGEQKAITSIIDCMHAEGYWGGKVRIAHCQNEKVAESLKTLITKEFAKADVEIYACRGLCSFYAEKGGVLVGFEKK
ncbi:MAG: DegV family protein [Clostridia bacterium]|nr:DegV family protein [Clostridia bacterium]